MNPLFSEALGSIVRWLLTAAAGILIGKGIWTQEQAAGYITAAAGAVVVLVWSLWQKYEARQKLATALVAASTTEEQIELKMKAGQRGSASTPKQQVPRLMSLAVVSMLVFNGCGGKNITVVVGQSGLAVTQAIGQVQLTTKQLTDANIIPPPVALKMQEGLLALNTRLEPLPALLITIDKLQQSGQNSTTPVNQAIDILEIVGQDLSVLIQGVPIADTTTQLVQLIRTAQQTVQTTLAEIAKIKGAQP